MRVSALHRVGFLLFLFLCSLSAGSEVSHEQDEEKRVDRPTPREGRQPRILKGRTSETSSPFKILAVAGRKALGGGLPGAAAGVLQVVTLMWLRTTMNYQYRFGGSVGQAMRSLHRQGGVRRFYQGVGFAILQGPLARFGAAAANEGMLSVIAATNVKSASGIALCTAVASVLAGLWRLLIMPLDTCKTILQVEGRKGFKTVVGKVIEGDIGSLYAGAYASAVATMVGHYPWYSTYNFLNGALEIPRTTLKKLMRNAFIGMAASLISDLATNWIRVIKTTKQSSATWKQMSYADTFQFVLNTGGVKGLLFRGLSTRIIANAIQSMVFTVFWRFVADSQAQRQKQRDGRGSVALRGGAASVDSRSDSDLEPNDDSENGEEPSEEVPATQDAKQSRQAPPSQRADHDTLGSVNVPGQAQEPDEETGGMHGGGDHVGEVHEAGGMDQDAQGLHEEEEAPRTN